MRILTRYVLVELGKVFLLSLVALTGMMVIIGVVREAVSQSLPPAQLVRLIPYILPDALRVAVPVTLLLATTNVYARISGSNELIAIKSLGIRPMTIIWPALVLAFLLSLGTVVLNDVAVSWGRNGVRRVIIEAADEIAYGMLRTQGRYSSSRFDIDVARVVGRRLIRPTVMLKGHGNAPEMIVTAEEAELRCDRQENVLKITVRNGSVEVEGRATLQFPDWEEFVIPLWDASQAGKSPSWLPLRVIPREIVEQRAEIEAYGQELAARAAYQMLCGDFGGLTGPAWQTHQQVLDDMSGRLQRLRTEPFRRWSAGFSCLSGPPWPSGYATAISSPASSSASRRSWWCTTPLWSARSTQPSAVGCPRSRYGPGTSS